VQPEPRIGEVLPRASEALVPRAKLVKYALDPHHPKGRHKAAVFRSVLDIEQAQWRELRAQIIAGLPVHPVSSDRSDQPEHATWGVVMPITGLNGRTAPVVTTWRMVDGVPWLVSAFVSKKHTRAHSGGLTL
jgi:hypothetical protein